MRTEKIQFIVRIILGLALTVLIWCRVDWSVGILSLLTLINSEVISHFFKSLTNNLTKEQ